MHFLVYGDKNRVEIAQPAVLVPMDEMAQLPEPLLRFDTSTAQGLMDELWKAGIRPTEGAGSAGSMAAALEHLKDMRRIAFHQLGIGGEK
jgi:hypothetical protein